MSGKVRNLLFETFHVLASYAGKRSKAKLRMPNTLINGFGFEQPTYVHNKTDGTLLFEKAPAPDKILKSWGTPFQAWIKYPGETKQVEKVLETNMNKAKDKLLAGDWILQMVTDPYEFKFANSYKEQFIRAKWKQEKVTYEYITCTPKQVKVKNKVSHSAVTKISEMIFTATEALQKYFIQEGRVLKSVSMVFMLGSNRWFFLYFEKCRSVKSRIRTAKSHRRTMSVQEPSTRRLIQDDPLEWKTISIDPDCVGQVRRLKEEFLNQSSGGNQEGRNTPTASLDASFTGKEALTQMQLSELEISQIRSGVERELEYSSKMMDYVREFANYRKLACTPTTPQDNLAISQAAAAAPFGFVSNATKQVLLQNIRVEETSFKDRRSVKNPALANLFK